MAEKQALTQRDYVVPLSQAARKSYTKKANKVMAELKRFVEKHTRNPNVVVTPEVNHFVWKQGKFNTPGKVPVTLVQEEGRVKVYLQGSTAIEADRKITQTKQADLKKQAEKKKKEEKTEKGKQEKAAAEEQKKKLEEKREKEKAAQALGMKRG